MIVTFSKDSHAAKQNMLSGVVRSIVDGVSVDQYRLDGELVGNLVAAITWYRGRRVRFTIETRDAYKRGSRRSASGRHMRKASWEAHRDVMRQLFSYDSQATIRTAFATYRGREDFEASFPATAHHNVGSMMHPVTIRECSI